MIQTDVLGEGGVQCIIVEIDIGRPSGIFSAEILTLELIEENGVEIGLGRLNRAIRWLRKVLLVEAPVQFVDGIHWFVGGFSSRGHRLLNQGGFIGRGRSHRGGPCAHDAQQRVQLVFEAPLVSDGGKRRRLDYGGRRRRLGCNAGGLHNRLFGLLGKRVVEAQVKIGVEDIFRGLDGRLIRGGDSLRFVNFWLVNFDRLSRATVEIHVDIGHSVVMAGKVLTGLFRNGPSRRSRNFNSGLLHRHMFAKHQLVFERACDGIVEFVVEDGFGGRRGDFGGFGGDGVRHRHVFVEHQLVFERACDRIVEFIVEGGFGRRRGDFGFGSHVFVEHQLVFERACDCVVEFIVEGGFGGRGGHGGGILFGLVRRIVVEQ
ncbi:hypothetical protein [Mesorhizobium sp.]|uniref:hypothetical protein n=1 Tax=Mesorhizobium sp. TaxID=1871066 RepID=UPI0034401B93